MGRVDIADLVGCELLAAARRWAVRSAIILMTSVLQVDASMDEVHVTGGGAAEQIVVEPSLDQVSRCRAVCWYHRGPGKAQNSFPSGSARTHGAPGMLGF